MTNVIEVTNPTKRYRDTPAVDSVTFAIAKDTILGPLGPTGPGTPTGTATHPAPKFRNQGRVQDLGGDRGP